MKNITKIKELIEIRERLKEIARTVEYLAGSIEVVAKEIYDDQQPVRGTLVGREGNNDYRHHD